MDDHDAVIVVTPYGAPEALFRLGPMEVGDGTARAVMATGPWLADTAGRPMAGALGVVVDDVLGQVVLARAPAGWWPVTTELSIDVAGAVPLDGAELEVVAGIVHADAAGGLSRGTVRDATGQVRAVGSFWAAFVPGRPDPEQLIPVAVDPATLPAPSSIVRVGSGGAVLPDLPLVTNANGVVHGGMLAFAAERAARAAAPAALETASLRVRYLRPAVAPVALTTRVVHAGRVLAAVEVAASGMDGRLCGSATVGFRARP